MTVRLLHRAENGKLLLFFNGWSMDDTLFEADFFWETTVCSFSLPNCRSARRPNSEEAPLMSEELVGSDTLPPSINLMISSSLPS